jgi:uncharacterized protein
MTHTPLSQDPAATKQVAADLREAGPLIARPGLPVVTRLSASASRPGRFCVGSSAPRHYAGIRNRQPSQQATVEGGTMFEEQPQQEIDALMRSNPEFKQLYQRHRDLDKKVMDAELGVLPIDDATLSQMKREKLAAKDRLVRLYDAGHH